MRSSYCFGISFEIIEREKYAINFWISTKNIDVLDSNYITKDNVDIYSMLSQQLTNILSKDFLILCGIGSEILVNDKGDNENIVNSSSNVCEWIFPYDKPYKLLDRYEKNIINTFTVYSLHG